MSSFYKTDECPRPSVLGRTLKLDLAEAELSRGNCSYMLRQPRYGLALLIFDLGIGSHPTTLGSMRSHYKPAEVTNVPDLGPGAFQTGVAADCHLNFATNGKTFSISVLSRMPDTPSCSSLTRQVAKILGN